MKATAIRRLTPVALLGVAVLYAACGDGDSRTRQITPGMSSESALKVLGADPAAAISADTLRNVWRKTSFLMDGQHIDVLYYSPNNEHWRATDTVPEDKVIPVVSIDGKVVGVGQRAYDSVSKIYRLPKNKY